MGISITIKDTTSLGDGQIWLARAAAKEVLLTVFEGEQRARFILSEANRKALIDALEMV